MIGLFTRRATIPLLIDISVAIATTKIPMLSRAGFGSIVHEARTDYCILLGLVFLLWVGSGPFSVVDAQTFLTGIAPGKFVFGHAACRIRNQNTNEALPQTGERVVRCRVAGVDR